MRNQLGTTIQAIGLLTASFVALLGCGAEPGDGSAEGTPLGTILTDGSDASRARSELSSRVSPAGEHDVRSFDVPTFDSQALSLVPQVPAADGSLVQYTGIMGAEHTLRRFNGAHTSLLVSDAVTNSLGIARIRQMVEEHDIVYQAIKELMNGEVGVIKPQSIAAVGTCGLGCFTSDGGRVEIDEGFFQDEAYLDVVIHELIHAFDQYAPFVFVGPQEGHSWTWFWEMYVRAYLKQTHFERLPTLNVKTGFTSDEFYDYRVKERFSNVYEAYSPRSWSTCILNAGCDPAGSWSAQDMQVTAQGGVILRIAQLHGPTAMKSFLPKLQTLIAQRGYTTTNMTNQDRIDLLVESLSQAANTNLSCYFGAAAWNWPISSAAQTRLNTLPANALCNDSDADGVRRFQRDCNDSNAAIKPGATETANSIDDDCDGIVDDLLSAETSDYSNSPSTPKVLGFPAHVTGGLGSTSDQDHFRFSLSAPTTVRFTLRSPSTLSGRLTLLQQGSTTNEYTHWDLSDGQLTSFKVNLSAGNWSFFMSGGATGSYELFVHASTRVDMANDFWPLTFTPAVGSVATGGPNRYSLPVPATPSAISGTPNLLAHYWVSNFGLVGSVAAGSTTPLVWTGPSDTDPRKINYRVQYRANGLPVYATSQHVGVIAPRPWTSQDIGTVGVPGSTSQYSEADFSLNGSGADIGGSSDAFRFASTSLTGDGEVIAQVINLTNTHASAKAGVMLRATNAPGSAHAMMVLTPSGLSFQRRTATGGSTTATAAGGATPNPAWVRIARSGNTFTGYYSSDGKHWTSVGSASITIGTAVLAGVVVTSHDNAVLATGNFDHVGVGPIPTALLVTNSTTLGTGDTAVRNRLQNLGYAVTVKDAPSTVAGDATGKTLVVVSSTVASGDVNSKFRNVAVPVLTWESAIFDDMGMTGTIANTDFGTQASQTQINVVLPSHDLASGLSGLVTAGSSSPYSWGVPNANAACVGKLNGSSTKCVIFAYDVGASMPGSLVAPARRVGLFLGDTTATGLSSQGWALFDAAIRWASVR